MTAKIYIPALIVIVFFISVIAAIMIHTHDRKVADREYYRNSNNQALAASCLALEKEGATGSALAGCPKDSTISQGN